MVLAHDVSTGVRTIVADSPHLDMAVAKVLAGDSSANVRERLALNRATPAYVLNRLLDDEEHRVMGAAVIALQSLHLRDSIIASLDCA